MTIKQKIKKASNVYVWVQTCQDDGVYIQVSKSALLKSVKEYPEHMDTDKFELGYELQDVNIPNLYVN